MRLLEADFRDSVYLSEIVAKNVEETAKLLKLSGLEISLLDEVASSLSMGQQLDRVALKNAYLKAVEDKIAAEKAKIEIYQSTVQRWKDESGYFYRSYVESMEKMAPWRKKVEGMVAEVDAKIPDTWLGSVLKKQKTEEEALEELLEKDVLAAMEGPELYRKRTAAHEYRHFTTPDSPHFVMNKISISADGRTGNTNIHSLNGPLGKDAVQEAVSEMAGVITEEVMFGMLQEKYLIKEFRAAKRKLEYLKNNYGEEAYEYLLKLCYTEIYSYMSRLKEIGYLDDVAEGIAQVSKIHPTLVGDSLDEAMALANKNFREKGIPIGMESPGTVVKRKWEEYLEAHKKSDFWDNAYARFQSQTGESVPEFEPAIWRVEERLKEWEALKIRLQMQELTSNHAFLAPYTLSTLKEGIHLYNLSLYTAVAYLRFAKQAEQYEDALYMFPVKKGTVGVESYVVDQETGEPLEGAKVELYYERSTGELIKTLYTNRNGKVYIHDLSFRKGSYYLVYSKEGYHKAVHAFKINKDKKFYDCGKRELRPIMDVRLSPTPIVTPAVSPNAAVAPMFQTTTSPTATSTPQTTASPTVKPAATPKPTAKPMPTATSMPTLQPTAASTATPIPVFTVVPTPVSISTPTAQATMVPTQSPTAAQSAQPLGTAP